MRTRSSSSSPQYSTESSTRATKRTTPTVKTLTYVEFKTFLTILFLSRVHTYNQQSVALFNVLMTCFNFKKNVYIDTKCDQGFSSPPVRIICVDYV